MLEKILVNVRQHVIVSYSDSRFVVDSQALEVLGRLYEGTLEASRSLGEAWCLVDRYLNDDVRQAVVEKLVAKAVAQAPAANF